MIGVQVIVLTWVRFMEAEGLKTPLKTLSQYALALAICGSLLYVLLGLFPTFIIGRLFKKEA